MAVDSCSPEVKRRSRSRLIRPLSDDTEVAIGMDAESGRWPSRVASDEQVLGGGRFATDAEGFTSMLAYAAAWPNRVWAIEGCEGSDRHIAHRLSPKVSAWSMSPAKLSARVRILATGQGRKNDDTDAHSIAWSASA